MKCTKHGVKNCTAPECVKERIKKKQQEESLRKVLKGEY